MDEIFRRHIERYEAAMTKMLAEAKLHAPCLAQCHGVRCEKANGHKGAHLTTEGGGYGRWAPHQSDPPTVWDRIVDGIGV